MKRGSREKLDLETKTGAFKAAESAALAPLPERRPMDNNQATGPQNRDFSKEQALAPVPDRQDMQMSAHILRPIVKPSELIEAHKEITVLITQALVSGTDYGVIPGAKKPSLLKPGAERLLKAFGCHAEYVVLSQETDHDRVVTFQKKYGPEGRSIGLYRFVVECRVISSRGVCVGTGIGSASTMEAKYIDRPRDLENTVLKMAQKRAMVAAVLNAFGLSDRFTQDVEDMSMGQEAKSKRTTVSHDPPAAPIYDPDDYKHSDALTKKLRARDIPEGRFVDISEALKGRPTTDLDQVLKELQG